MATSNTLNIKEQNIKKTIDWITIGSDFDDDVRILNSTKRGLANKLIKTKNLGLNSSSDDEPIEEPEGEEGMSPAQKEIKPFESEDDSSYTREVISYPQNEEEEISPKGLEKSNIQYVIHEYEKKNSGEMYTIGVILNEKEGGYLSIPGPALKGLNITIVGVDDEEADDNRVIQDEKLGQENLNKITKSLKTGSSLIPGVKYFKRYDLAFRNIFLSSGISVPKNMKIEKPETFTDIESAGGFVNSEEPPKINSKNEEQLSLDSYIENVRPYVKAELAQYKKDNIPPSQQLPPEDRNRIRDRAVDDILSLAAMIMVETGANNNYAPYATCAVALTRQRKGWYGGDISKIVNTKEFKQAGKSWNNSDVYKAKYDNFKKMLRALLKDADLNWQLKVGLSRAGFGPQATEQKASEKRKEIESNMKSFESMRYIYKDKESGEYKKRDTKISKNQRLSLRKAIIIASYCLEKKEEIMDKYKYPVKFIHPSGMPTKSPNERNIKSSNIYPYDFENEILYPENTDSTDLDKVPVEQRKKLSIPNNPKHPSAKGRPTAISGGLRYLPKWVINSIQNGSAIFPSDRNILIMK